VVGSVRRRLERTSDKPSRVIFRAGWSIGGDKAVRSAAAREQLAQGGGSGSRMTTHTSAGAAPPSGAGALARTRGGTRGGGAASLRKVAKASSNVSLTAKEATKLLVFHRVADFPTIGAAAAQQAAACFQCLFRFPGFGSCTSASLHGLARFAERRLLQTGEVGITLNI
jgi:hypothetical protein